MKTNPISFVGAFLLVFFCNYIQAQSFGTVASAVWISDCNQSNFYNTSGTTINEIGPTTNVFANANLGSHTQNSSTLILRGAQVKTFTDPAIANVCNLRMFYRVYLQSASPGAFTSIDLPFLEDCDVPSSQFPSGGPCQPGDQKWQRIIADGETIPYAPIDLTNHTPGSYVLEVYYEAAGSFTSTTLCNDIVTLNNAGANYKATFSVQAPTISSANPSTCGGTQGSITISGLTAGASYDLNYTDDSNPVGPITMVANSSGQLIISGLNAGLYSNFSLTINGCTTNLFTGVILSNPIFVPAFTAIPPFCTGTANPVLPTTSNNGVSGTWSPVTVNNQTSGTYTFTPNAGQCGLPVTINVTVIQRAVPLFSFGTSLAICSGGTVPNLPNNSTNGINGTWSPSVVSNTAPGTYTFTPNAALCASPTTFTVAVSPNLTPAFSFGTSLTICTGETVPALPTTSINNITGTWSPAAVDNQNLGTHTYTFTPTAGQCAIPNTFTVTVNTNLTPTFSFGTSLSLCAGATTPTLPGISDNIIGGTWSPATISNQNSDTYTFTPSDGQCAVPTSVTVTVNPNITPTFSFGTSQTICAGNTAPSFPPISVNGITGTWNPAAPDNQQTGTYTFTPTAGQCATTATFTLTVSPNITPVFSFGTSLPICAGATVPGLPANSSNGIAGTWSPTTVSNQSTGTYTFTPDAGLCAVPTTLTVTVSPNITPVFSFGTTLTVCAEATAPALPNSSTNGINGTWNPAVINNQVSGTYTFTPTAGQCAVATSFTVTVTPNITPTFSFGTSQTICAGNTAPSFPPISVNGITGTWSPTVPDNQATGIYTFTPSAGQCATSTTFTLNVDPNITPDFSFGTSLTICAGGTVFALPGTSINGITGTWSPAAVDNQNQGTHTYTFTPTPGLCATTNTFTVTVNPNLTPGFAFGTSLTICAGATAPVLPNSSINGINGTWSPAVVNNQTTGTYTFTPTAGQCAVPVSFTVTVTPNITPTFSFGTGLTICAGATAPSFPPISVNGITGTWNPAAPDNQETGSYIFTPTTGQCATTATFTLTVNPNITPVFSFGTSLPICAGATVPALPTNSSNGIAGTWTPATISNQNSDTYTFTPAAGLCAVPTTLTVTVSPNITPVFSFGTTLTICAGDAVPTLATTSTNGITGTWNPAVVNAQASGAYTFTPTAGQCATATSFEVTVTQKLNPAFSFGTSLTICAGATAPGFPPGSLNGITGTWSPAVIDNQNSGVYTFTPTAGLCANNVTLTVTVNPNITPNFSFGTSLTICAGGTVLPLPGTSLNGITGTWNPAAVDNQNLGTHTYTFTPTAGQCATTNTFTLTINANITPVFNFGPTLTVCAGATVPTLPNTSDNGIIGTWSPAVVDNQATGTYIFTPAAGLCATSTTFTVTVNPNTTPVFSFGTSLSICAGSTVPSFPPISTNSITGTWNPGVIDNQNSGVYTFTPTAGLCATTATLTVTVIPNVTPVFDFGINLTICAGATIPGLPTTSSNGVTGAWSPATIDNEQSGVYTFTPTAGQCVIPATVTFTVTVTPNIVPTFNFNNSLTICAGAPVPLLPATSNNGLNGVWNPAVVSDQANGVYVFTPAAGQCVTPFTFTVTVNPIIVPVFSFGISQSVCIGSAIPVFPATSTNGITGTWNPAVVNNQASGTYTFMPSAGQCAGVAGFELEVNAIPTISSRADTTVYDGAIVPLFNLNESVNAVVTWTNSNPAIGLAASGTGNIPSFTAINKGNDPITAIITVTPKTNGCTGTVLTYVITVLPLDKDVFVPNVFSPNRDGKNDILYVYGNYIDKVDMRIFNQWGQQIAAINSKTQGWDGTHKGNPQPVGVYVYVARVVLADGRIIDRKGSITLVR